MRVHVCEEPFDPEGKCRFRQRDKYNQVICTHGNICEYKQAADDVVEKFLKMFKARVIKEVAL